MSQVAAALTLLFATAVCQNGAQFIQRELSPSAPDLILQSIEDLSLIASELATKRAGLVNLAAEIESFANETSSEFRMCADLAGWKDELSVSLMDLEQTVKEDMSSSSQVCSEALEELSAKMEGQKSTVAQKINSLSQHLEKIPSLLLPEPQVSWLKQLYC